MLYESKAYFELFYVAKCDLLRVTKLISELSIFVLFNQFKPTLPSLELLMSGFNRFLFYLIKK